MSPFLFYQSGWHPQDFQGRWTCPDWRESAKVERSSADSGSKSLTESLMVVTAWPE
jgi:hypothetical protein